MKVVDIFFYDWHTFLLIVLFFIINDMCGRTGFVEISIFSPKVKKLGIKMT